MPAEQERLYTVDEFYDMFDKTNERVELIDGRVVMQAAPTLTHQRIVGGVYRKIADHIDAKRGKCSYFMSPVDVRLDKYTTVQPDVLVVCDPSKLDDKRIMGAPDFVVEVVSSDTLRDYRRKLTIYQKFGVREYWIIDPDEERTTVYLFGDPVNVGFYDFDKPVPVGIFGGELCITVKDLIM
ncbi:MAG: Uma2 family endonuclease [Ruminococcus sp.]|nr:Uma2 family endonuclease [Ruminococcus sp.]